MHIPISNLPGLSPLVQDYFSHFEKVQSYFSGDFRSLSAFRGQTEKIRGRDLQRQKLAEIVKKQNLSFGCGEKTLENIDRLRRKDTFAVVTGQQVGLFSGPLYTVYKALTAVQLAGYLSENLEENFVPVFWPASDDHDFAEIDFIRLIDKNNRIKTISYQPDSTPARIPAANIMIRSAVMDCLNSLSDMTHDTEFKSEILTHLQEDYRPGRTFPEAFSKWLMRMFKSRGLIILDAAQLELKALGRAVFSREISHASPSTQAAQQVSQEIKAAGYPTQIKLRKGVLNLFAIEGERRAIHIRENGFEISGSGRILSREELLARVDEKPESFSPNVLLRPVYQDHILPTAVYVGGPGEVAYFAQMKGVYRDFGIPMPIIYPRKSFTLLEKKAAAVLNRYELEITDIWQDPAAVVRDVLAGQVPGTLEEGIRAAGNHLTEDFLTIREHIKTLDSTLEKSAEAALGRMTQQLGFLENKILKAVKQRNTETIRRLQKAVNLLFPLNRLQERELNIVPFIIKYGYGLIDRLEQNLELSSFDHQVVQL